MRQTRLLVADALTQKASLSLARAAERTGESIVFYIATGSGRAHVLEATGRSELLGFDGNGAEEAGGVMVAKNPQSHACRSAPVSSSSAFMRYL